MYDGGNTARSVFLRLCLLLIMGFRLSVPVNNGMPPGPHVQLPPRVMPIASSSSWSVSRARNGGMGGGKGRCNGIIAGLLLQWPRGRHAEVGDTILYYFTFTIVDTIYYSNTVDYYCDCTDCSTVVTVDSSGQQVRDRDRCL